MLATGSAGQDDDTASEGYTEIKKCAHSIVRFRNTPQ